MAQTIVMPKLGLTMTEGIVTQWHKREGDDIGVGDDLFEVETDKLTNTVTATQAGVLRRILVAEGTPVKVLVPVALIAAADEDISAILADATGLVEASIPPPPPPPPAPEPEVRAAEPEAPAAPPTAPPAEPAPVGGRIVAAPAAKKLAQEKGVDLAALTGTGPNGRIRIEDVERYLATAPAPIKASPLAAAMAADQGIDLAEVPAEGRVMSADVTAFVQSRPDPREERVPMSAMRRVIAQRTRASADIAPRVTLNLSADMTAMVALKRDLAADGLKVSYTDLLVKVVSRILLVTPQLNCTIDGNDIVYRHYVNMGVAVALPDGLVVPVIRNTDAMSLAEISAAIKQVAGLARDGKLTGDDLVGGTFSITNLGGYGIESFTPIINQPEVAILGVNALADTVVAVGGAPAVRPMMRFSLTVDHRAVDGAVGAEFLDLLKKYLENPALMIMA